MRTLKRLIFQKNPSPSKVDNFLREGLLGIKRLGFLKNLIGTAVPLYRSSMEIIISL